jgi:hypothetical protein
MMQTTAATVRGLNAAGEAAAAAHCRRRHHRWGASSSGGSIRNRRLVSPRLAAAQNADADATRRRRRPNNNNNCRHFVNLKNGIEAIPTLKRELQIVDYDFVRIQSSLLEAGNVEKMILELDAALLAQLALGRSCFVWDYGSRDVVKGKGNPRALWYGVEFVRFALRREWFPDGVGATAPPPVLRGKQVEKDWTHKLSMLSRGAKRKIRYYKQFIPEGVCDVRLIGVYRPTTHDDDVEFYRSTLFREEEIWNDDDATPTTSSSGGGVSMSEEETVRAIEELGFHLFYSGAEEPAWLNQIKPPGGR